MDVQAVRREHLQRIRIFQERSQDQQLHASIAIHNYVRRMESTISTVGRQEILHVVSIQTQVEFTMLL